MRISIYLSILFLAISLQLQAQGTLSVQGTIQKSFGAAVEDGEYSLTFKLYESPTGGTAVWTETQNEVEVVGGVYSVLLGEVNPLTAAFNTTYYLGVSVDGGAELIPRARLTSSPYALSLIGQDNSFPSTGSVGIGTASPDSGYKLHVTGHTTNALVQGSNSATINFEKLGAYARIGFIEGPDYHNGTCCNFRIMPGENHTIFHYGSAERLRLTDWGADFNGSYAIHNGNLNLNNGNLYAKGGLADFDAGGSDLILKMRGQNVSTLKLTYGNGNDFMELAALSGFSSIFSNNKPLFITGPSDNRFSIFSDKATLNTMLEFSGAKLSSVDYHRFFYVDATGTGGTSSDNVAVKAIGYAVHCSMIRTPSDRRTKKDIRLSEGAADLARLMQLRVSDFRKVDVITQGSHLHKGFIAQEVAQVFPEAVNQSEEYIPDIYLLASKTSVADGRMTLKLDKDHGLAAGDEVKIITPGSEHKLAVIATPSSQSFSVEWQDEAVSQAFVYGKKVKDFSQVEYDQIHTLNVSATQELARKVAQLEEDNAALYRQNEKLQQQNEGLRSDLNGMNERLLKLETRLSGNAQR